jgi:hypothetical protein
MDREHIERILRLEATIVRRFASGALTALHARSRLLWIRRLAQALQIRRDRALVVQRLDRRIREVTHLLNVLGVDFRVVRG